MAENNEQLAGMVDQSGGAESDFQVSENSDGSADIIGQKPQPAPNRDFYRNLAEDLLPDELELISKNLLELIDKDKVARKERDEQISEGKKRMGLSKETTGGANFTGASMVTHPMYTKASIDFEARAIKELFPPGGPCREYVAGTMSADRVDRAHRTAKWMNIQLTSMLPNFRAELEQILINLPMDGNAYQKLLPPAPDRDIRYMGHEWIPVDKMLLPFAASNYYRAERRTHVQDMTALEFERRVRQGMYRSVESHYPEEPEGSETQKVVQKIEGKEADQTNPDGLRVVYECDCLYEIRDPDVKGSENESPLEKTTVGQEEMEVSEVGPLPYLISIDESTKEVVAIYRNWDESDDQRTRLEWTVEWSFIPFRGAYALGLPHIIGGLSIAATGALRALLDSAHIATFPGMIKLKGAAGTGQNIQPSPTEVTEIQNSGEIDDVRKIIMPIPFKEPSPVLLTLLGLLGDQAEQVIRTTIDESESRGDVPVGTTLARIEQGMVAFSAIHARLHDSMSRLLKMLHRINQTWLDDKIVEEYLGEQLVTQADFVDSTDVTPVSDPNIFCEVQRYGQIQTVSQRAVLLAQLGQPVYDLRKVEELILKQMKLPNDGKDLLVPKPSPEQMNPVNENVALSLGRPIVALPQQDQDAHITTHCDFFEHPFFSQMISQNLQAMSSLAQHLKEHVVFWYATAVHKLGSEQATHAAQSRDPKAGKIDIGDLPQNSKEDPEIAQLYDQMLAKASAITMKQAQQDPGVQRAVQVMAKIQQAIQQMMQQQQPQQPDQGPMAQAKMMDSQLQHQDRQAATQQKQQASQQGEQAKIAIANIKDQGDTRRQQLADQAKMQTTLADNQTAVGIEQEKTRNAQMNTMMSQQHESRMAEQQNQHAMQQGAQQHAHALQQGEQQGAQQMQQQEAQGEQQAAQQASQQAHEAAQSNVTDGQSVGKKPVKPSKGE